jgi:acyl-CoA thioester hydrolase
VSAFSWFVRVYWEDTDAGGVVYHANYLNFFERARTEWLRSCGFSQRVLAEDPGIIFPVIDLAIQYRRPAHLDDELLVSCTAQRHGATSIRFVQRISRHPSGLPASAQTLAEAQVRVVCVDAATFRPKRLPAFLSNALAAPEPQLT